MDTPHPWRWLRDHHPHVLLHWHDLPPGYRGTTDGHSNIWMRRRLVQRERRSTLAHELEHIRRNHRGCQREAVERVVRHHAARWLLPDLGVVLDAVVWARGDFEHAAEELWVDRATVLARLDLRHLHPAEKTLVQRRIDDMVQEMA
ncbi:hypothetical protein [Auraticoccus monumenti]|uniref:IrrE N-terminal-like domain-containing protein n=1 Tax=Auraticoccus monumenti TaxID=675864 RepID=A0A1G6USQ4_9ACTN|nr:hypothetical protein [Auraticoccus monumenti]SDD43746.1 hypothetical protein SAMN04489747_0946 [Auraticoccus monumenti]